MILAYVEGATRPATTITWQEDDALVDFSTGWTFIAKLFVQGAAASLVTKTTGITGAATDPNVTINWTTADLGALDPGNYTLEVTATSGGAVYRRQWGITVAEAAP